MLNHHKYFHWFYYDRKKGISFILGSGIFFWLFLVITKPFGIYETNVSDLALFLFLLPVGILWVVVVIGIDWIGRAVFKLKSDSRPALDLALWGIKLMGIIHLIYLLRGLSCGWSCMDFLEYLQLWLAFFLMFAICYLPFSYYARFQFFQRMLVQGNKGNFDLVLEGEGKEKTLLKAHQLIYVQAADNYVDLHLIDENNQPRKMVLRTSLKALEEQLKRQSAFVRIHRSYLINSSYFNAFAKGESSLKLVVADQTITLPVSGKYKAVVSGLFTHPK